MKCSAMSQNMIQQSLVVAVSNEQLLPMVTDNRQPFYNT